MTENQSTATAQTYSDEVSPDSLMDDFRGRSLGTILGFTVIVHVVLVGVFSMQYLKNDVLGADTSSLNEEERLESAVNEATKSLRKIAERHGVSPQDLSERFANSDSRPSSVGTEKPANPDGQDASTASDDSTPQEPRSAIETELQKKADGPSVPNLPPLGEEEDLFK